MPTEKVSRDKLSELLFLYLSMGSDMTEMLVILEEDYVLNDEIIIYVILTVWTICLLQFTFYLTASRSDNDKDESGGQCCQCCTTTVLTTCSTVFLQDAPSLAVRLYIIIKNKTLSYTILFFTLKNALILSLQAYRLLAVVCCPKGPNEYTPAEEGNLRASKQNVKLLAKVRKRSSKKKNTEYAGPAKISDSVPYGNPPLFPSQTMKMNTDSKFNPRLNYQR